MPQREPEKVLDNLGYTNIVPHLAEETLGWLDDAPYDAIIATAAAPRIPLELVEQLGHQRTHDNSGRLPVYAGALQSYPQEKKTRIVNLGSCRFVSLIGKGAWEEEQV